MNLSTNEKKNQQTVSKPYSSQLIKEICLEAGAGDVGFIEITRKALDFERNDILTVYPKTKSIISIIKLLNRESILSPTRYVANTEFHHVTEEIGKTSRRIVSRLNDLGIRGLSLSPGFPMDMTKWPNKIWSISHKIVAVEAGLGKMGINRNVIHPQFGNFIILDSILIDAELDRYNQAVNSDPCVECRLCIPACPVGAIQEDKIDFMACMTHNYREFLPGFQDWTEKLVSSKSVSQYRKKFNDSETASIWQSLSFGANYKAAYCMAVCPAGDNIINEYLDNKKEYSSTILKPFKSKKEPLYVIKGTRAEFYAKKNKTKTLRYVQSPIRPNNIPGFLQGIQIAFDPLKGKGLELNIHFNFTGLEPCKATVKISEGSLSVQESHEGKADLLVHVDSESWIRFLNKEVSLFRLILTRKLKIKGNPIKLKKFQDSLAV